jgi:prophage antirepressor-like protein
MSAIQIFQFDTASVRTLPQAGAEPLFVAKDVALALGYANPADAIITHCRRRSYLGPVPLALPDQQNQHLIGLHSETVLIPESDVYLLVMRSQLESAERFQDWVVEEVLPTLRKTGRYEVSRPPSAQSEAAELLKIELDLYHLFDVPLHIAQVEAVKRVRLQTGVDFMHLLEHASAQSGIVEEETMLEPKDMAAAVGIQNAAEFNKWLGRLGYQVKSPAGWEPTDTGKPYSVKHQWRTEYKSGYNLKWSKKFIHSLLPGDWKFPETSASH